MKVCIIADTHFGVRSDDIHMLNHYRKFYSDIFFPTLDKYKIKNIIHCGDLVDRRKYINFNTAVTMNDIFINPITERGIKLDVIVGNHDVYNKNTNDINALNVLLDKQSNINYYIDPEIIIINNKRLLLLPWITNSNTKQSMDYIKNSDCEYCFAHLDLIGFEMYKGLISEHGLTLDMFKNYKHVFTGHYHYGSTKENITYIGSPYEMTWSDYNDRKRFGILCLDTGEVEWIINPYKIFNKIYYNEDKKNKIDLNQLKNTYIKVVVENKTKQKLFDNFIDKLYEQDPIDLQIIDQQLINETNSIDIDTNQVKETIDIIQEYVDKSDIKYDKKVIVKRLIQLYNEANQIEE